MDFKLKPLPNNLRDQLYQIPLNKGSEVVSLKTKSAWMAAAGILVLITINVLVIQKTLQNEDPSSDLTGYNDYFYQYNAIR